MKKKILTLSFLAAFALASGTTDEGLDLLLNDAKAINTYAMDSLDKIAKSDEELKNFEAKVESFSKEVAKFEQEQLKPFSDTKEALSSMEKLEELSSQSMVLAKELAYLSSHHADNASEDYVHTLDKMLKTTLRLSDDIGVMADRILDMADKIGVMADRILKTQRIQSRNLDATMKLTQMAIQLTDSQLTQTRNRASKNVSSPIVQVSSAPQTSVMSQTSSVPQTSSMPR